MPPAIVGLLLDTVFGTPVTMFGLLLGSETLGLTTAGPGVAPATIGLLLVKASGEDVLSMASFGLLLGTVFGTSDNTFGLLLGPETLGVNSVGPGVALATIGLLLETKAGEKVGSSVAPNTVGLLLGTVFGTFDLTVGVLLGLKTVGVKAVGPDDVLIVLGLGLGRTAGVKVGSAVTPSGRGC